MWTCSLDLHGPSQGLGLSTNTTLKAVQVVPVQIVCVGPHLQPHTSDRHHQRRHRHQQSRTFTIIDTLPIHIAAATHLQHQAIQRTITLLSTGRIEPSLSSLAIFLLSSSQSPVLVSHSAYIAFVIAFSRRILFTVYLLSSLLYLSIL